ncbi:MAG: lactonase family protein [Pseudobutyrivibrio sp.]|nr:lactonase family protein [Pseudobutyrivibrio sp.]
MAAKKETKNDKKYLAYVGTYTHEKSVGIYVYDIEVETGVLTFKEVVPINNPSDISASRDKEFLYSIADEGVAAFKIQKDGSLQFLNLEWIGGMRGCYLRADSQRRFLFVAGYHDGRVTMMHLNPDGSIGSIADGIFHQGVGKSVAERPLIPHVNCVELTPDEKYLCAVDSGLHQMKIYEVDYEKGRLRLHDIVRCDMGCGPHRMRFSRDGKNAYIITENSNEILVYDYKLVDDKDASFELVQKVSLLPNSDARACTGTNVKINMDDDMIYASVDGLDAVVMFRRDKKTGLLDYLSDTAISGDYPKSFAILPGEKFIVSLNHDSNQIMTFSIDREKGHGLMAAKPISMEKPNSIIVLEIDQ